MQFPGQEYRLGCHFLLQGIFPTLGSSSRLLHWQADSLPLSQQGSPDTVDNTVLLLLPNKHLALKPGI